MNTLTVYLDNAVTHAITPDESSFNQWASVVCKHVPISGNLTVRIVGPTEMIRLNRQYRERDGATNVLSFTASKEGLPAELLDQDESVNSFLGDIAICAETVASESDAQNKSAEAHWAHLFVHGVLHLCGYDHVEPCEAEVMEALETKVVTALDFPDPYGLSEEIAIHNS